MRALSNREIFKDIVIDTKSEIKKTSLNKILQSNKSDEIILDCFIHYVLNSMLRNHLDIDNVADAALIYMIQDGIGIGKSPGIISSIKIDEGDSIFYNALITFLNKFKGRMLTSSKYPKLFFWFLPENINFISGFSINDCTFDKKERLVCYIGQNITTSLERLVMDLDGKNNNNESKILAAKELCKITPESIKSIPGLLNALNDNDDDVAFMAATALGRMGDFSINDLINYLSDENWKNRRGALIALTKSGYSGGALIPKIRKLVDDPNEIVREAALKCLTKYGSLAEENEKYAELPIISMSQKNHFNEIRIEMTEGLLSESEANFWLGNNSGKYKFKVTSNTLEMWRYLDETPFLLWKKNFSNSILGVSSWNGINLHCISSAGEAFRLSTLNGATMNYISNINDILDIYTVVKHAIFEGDSKKLRDINNEKIPIMDSFKKFVGDEDFMNGKINYMIVRDDNAVQIGDSEIKMHLTKIGNNWTVFELEAVHK